MVTRYWNIAVVFAGVFGFMMLFQNCGDFEAQSDLQSLASSSLSNSKSLNFTYQSLSGDILTKNVQYELLGENAVIEGDIVVGIAPEYGGSINYLVDSHGILKPRLNTVNGKKFEATKYNRGGKWPDGDIEIMISEDFDEFKRNEIVNDIDHLNSKLAGKVSINFKVVENSSQRNYIFIERDDNVSGRSYIGMNGGRQNLWLGISSNRRNLMHEFLHVLGLVHEHTRPDRDDYINVLWDNIRDSSKGNFEKKNYYSVIGTSEYDFYSIMHYPDSAGVKEFGLKSLEVQPAHSNKAIRYNTVLSDGDIEGVADFYPSLEPEKIISHSVVYISDTVRDYEFVSSYRASPTTITNDKTISGYVVVDSISIGDKLECSLVNLEVNESETNKVFEIIEASENMHYQCIFDLAGKVGEYKVVWNLNNEISDVQFEVLNHEPITPPIVRLPSQGAIGDLDNKTLADIAEHMCFENTTQANCVEYVYDYIESRTNKVELEDATYKITGLYNSWEITFSEEAHIESNYINSTSNNFLIHVNSCASGKYSGEYRNKNLNDHLQIFNLECQGRPLVIPTCTKEATDSDGDGWGWENNETCKVETPNTGNDLTPGNFTMACNNTDVGRLLIGSSRSIYCEITNYGGMNATITSLPEFNDPWVLRPSDCTVSDIIHPIKQLNTTLGTKRTCSLNIQFSPSVAAAYSEDIKISYSSGNTIFSIDQTITGIGLADPTGLPDIADCVETNSDLDGSGWGWENNKSCRIYESSKPGYPRCINSETDTDNDGWGWQNNSTCWVE